MRDGVILLNRGQKMPKDYKIEIDSAQAKVLGEVICQEIKTSVVENAKIYERARSRERAYAQVSKWAAKNKTPTQPWYGAADYFVPLTEWIVDAVHGRVLKALFAKRPYMKAVGTEASDTEKEDGVTNFVDQIHSEVIKVYENFRYPIKQMLKLPFAVIKYCWVKEYDRGYEKAQAMVFQSPDGKSQEQVLEEEQEKAQELVEAGYQPIGQEEVTTLREDELWDAPKLQYIKFADYVWHGKAKRGYKPYWEGDRFYLTIHEMMNNYRQFPDVVERIKNEALGNSSEMSLSDAVLAQRSKLIECFNFYGRFPIDRENKINHEDPEAIEQEVHAVVAYKDKEVIGINKWEYNRVPEKERVYIRGEFEETEEFVGRSLVDKLFMTQRELNTLHNNIMNNAQLAMMKIFWKRKTMTGDAWERPQLRPGVILDVDMPGDIGVLDVGDIKSISWELEASFINFAERISNISVYQTGTQRQGGQKTKGEVERTVYEGNIGMDKFIEQCSLVLQKICKWTVDYYYNNMPEGLERRIRGEDYQPIFPTQENMEMYQEKGILPYWQQDDLAGKFDWKWDNTSLNSSHAYQIQVSNDLQDRYLPHPMIQGSMLATWDILRRGLIARNITDWENILPPKEAIIAEMEKLQAEGEAKETVQKGEQNVGASAVQQAEQMGVPRETAEQILAQGGMNE